jgi:hypothetical protein
MNRGAAPATNTYGLAAMGAGLDDLLSELRASACF